MLAENVKHGVRSDAVGRPNSVVFGGNFRGPSLNLSPSREGLLRTLLSSWFPAQGTTDGPTLQGDADFLEYLNSCTY